MPKIQELDETETGEDWGDFDLAEEADELE